MELKALGLDDGFEQRWAAFLRPEHGLARVTAVDRGGFLIRDPVGEVYAEIA